MRAKAAVLASLVVLATLGVALIGATAASGQGQVHVVLPAGSLKTRFLDFRRQGLRLGDRVAAHGPLLDESRTTHVGTAYIDCLVQRRITDGSGLYDCTYVLELQDGQLVLQGLDPRGPGVASFAVLGGTGTYRNARGEATFTDSPGETDMVIEVTG
jgi:hypothetical protein